MKTLRQNIAERTPHIGEKIPATRALIWWDCENNVVTEFLVLDSRLVWGKYVTHESRLWDRDGYTSGACYTDWMINPRHTPLGLFAELAFDGRLPKGQALIPILKQFARIKGCDWAGHMLAALRSGDFIMLGQHVYV